MISLPLAVVVVLVMTLVEQHRTGGSIQQIISNTTDVVEIPIDEIKVNRRMRRTDEERIKDLAESIKNIGLLHNICVAKKMEPMFLLSGLHRLESIQDSWRTTIPATVRESNEHIDQLIEVEENLVRGIKCHPNCGSTLSREKNF